MAEEDLTEFSDMVDKHDDLQEELDKMIEPDTEEDGDSDDDLAEAAKGALLEYTIIDKGVEYKPSNNVIDVGAIQKATKIIGTTTATLILQGKSRTVFKCSACDEVFNTEADLSEHALGHINSDLCNTCGRAFDSNRALLIHKTHCMKTGSKLSMEESGLFNCNKCDRFFNYRSTLVNHKRTVHSEKCYICVLCEKAFPTSHDLHRHSFTHSSTKPFVCDRDGCKKGFTCKSSLNKHIRLKHQVDRTYECSVCKKKFQMLCDIQRHMFTHTSIRPFKCTICSKTYTCKSSLKQHISLAHGLQRLGCVFCTKTFRLQQDLDRHTATHTGSKQWQCSVCSKNYACKSSLAVHKRNVHQILHVSDDEKMDEETIQRNKEKAVTVETVEECVTESQELSDKEEETKVNLTVAENAVLLPNETERKGVKRKGRKISNPRKIKKEPVEN